MSKITIPREVADAIEEIWDTYGHEGIIKHMYLTNWTTLSDYTEGTKDESHFDVLRRYAKDNPITYMSALVNGYEVEETYQDGDFLYYSLYGVEGAGEVFRHGTDLHVMWWDERSDPLDKVLTFKGVTKATPEQVKREKQRRVFANVGRKWGEFKEGDVIHSNDDDLLIVEDQLDISDASYLLNDNSIKKIYFTDNAINLDNL